MEAGRRAAEMPDSIQRTPRIGKVPKWHGPSNRPSVAPGIRSIGRCQPDFRQPAAITFKRNCRAIRRQCRIFMLLRGGENSLAPDLCSATVSAECGRKPLVVGALSSA